MIILVNESDKSVGKEKKSTLNNYMFKLKIKCNAMTENSLPQLREFWIKERVLCLWV